MRRFFSAVWEVLVNSSRGMQASREYEQLSNLSDAQLAARGLTRDRLINHCFRNFY